MMSMVDELAYIVAGELPAELGSLNVVEINVTDNYLIGPIPNSMFNISTY